MEESFKLILIFVPLVAGAVSIFLAYQLMHKFRLPFVGSYFYYLVFLYIFGSYSLIGSGILEHLMISMQADQDTVRSSGIFATLPGIPIFFLSLYMLTRSVTEMLSRRIWKSFTIVYFIISVSTLFLYGFWAIKITRLAQGDYLRFMSVQRWVFSGVLMGTYLALTLMAMIISRNMVNHQRRFIQHFGWIYLLYMLLTCASFLLSGTYEIARYVFLIFFLSWHLIPILFMNHYLEKYHSETTTLPADFDTALKSFSVKFEISKREKDVVRLICKGLSNQEISDALYISLQTVKDHIYRIFIKTGVKNRVQLTNLIRTQQKKQ